MKYLLLAFTFITLHSFAQRSEVIEDSTQKKDILFSKSLLWIATTWKSANNVVQMKDPDAGLIVVHGNLSAKAKQVGVTMQGTTTTQVTIQVKDGKAKITFDKTVWEWSGDTMFTYEDRHSLGKRYWENWKEAIDKEIDSMIADYKKALKSNTDF